MGVSLRIGEGEMITFFDYAIFFLGFLCLAVGCLFSVVFILMLMDYAISLIAKYLRVYPMLCEFIWDYKHRKRRDTA